MCEERDGGDAVSGCSGGEESTSDTDYCVDPNTMDVPPTTATETNNAEQETTIVVEVETTTEEPEVTTVELEATTSAPVDVNILGPKVEAVSGSFCTPDKPCPACYGDCDVSATVL